MPRNYETGETLNPGIDHPYRAKIDSGTLVRVSVTLLQYQRESFVRNVRGVGDDAVHPDDTVDGAIDAYVQTCATVDAIVAGARRRVSRHRRRVSCGS